MTKEIGMSSKRNLYSIFEFPQDGSKQMSVAFVVYDLAIRRSSHFKISGNVLNAVILKIKIISNCYLFDYGKFNEFQFS